MNKRQISISTWFDYNIPIEKQIPLIAEAGLTHISLGRDRAHFNYFNEEDQTGILKLLHEYSLQIDTIHGPEIGKENAGELMAIAEAAVELRAPVIVLHGGPFSFGQNELEARLSELRLKCRELDTIARCTGVKFALENVLPGPATELIRKAILEADPATIGFCYDSSHDQIDGPNPFDLLLELKDRVIAVHLSDRIREFVDHVIPGEGFIDWETLCLTLTTAKMTFPLLLEVNVQHSSEKDTVKFLNLAYRRGCGLYDRIGR